MSVRRFRLIRDEDVTGSSGTGCVAAGVEFEDGAVAMRWRTKVRSTGVYDWIGDVETIHGHDGRTRIEWVDD